METNNKNNSVYTDEDLKISMTTELEVIEPEEALIVMEEDKDLTSKEVFKIVFLLLLAYVAFAIVPTIMFINVLGTSFWFSQVVTFGLAVLCIFTLGAHKPASSTQLLKRDMRKKQMKKR